MSKSIKEQTITNYVLHNVDFTKDDWSIKTIIAEMSVFLGERAAINVEWVKDVMINETTSKPIEIEKVKKVSITYTDLDDKIKTLDFLV